MAIVFGRELVPRAARYCRARDLIRPAARMLARILGRGHADAANEVPPEVALVVEADQERGLLGCHPGREQAASALQAD